MDKNYMTPAGFKALQEELRRLRFDERPKVTETVAWAASNGDRSENGDYLYGKKRLRQIDSRIQFLLQRLKSAEVIDPAGVKSDVVSFGATVTILDEKGVEKRFSIVGVDEVDAANGKISWQSPLAKALLKRRTGDLVLFKSPRGEQEVEIIDLRYEAD